MSQSKILMLSEVFYPEIGSGANRMTNLVLFLKEQGYSVDVITSEPSYPDKSLYEKEEYKDLEKEKLLHKDSNIIRVKGSKLKPTANFFNRLYIYIYFLLKSIAKVIFNLNSYDIVITTTPSIFMGVLGVIAKKRFKAKLIIDIRDLWPECIKNIGLFKRNKLALKIGYKLEKFILKRTDAAVVNSIAYKKYLTQNRYIKPIYFIPNGLSDSDFGKLENKYELSKKHEDFTVVYTGLIGIAQNVTSIVRVANRLRNATDIRFKIIGTGIQTARVNELISHYGLKNIEVRPPMPKEEVIEELCKCHVAIAHLRKDSAFDLAMPGKIIDYMSVGIPIIAGVEGVAEEVIKKSKSGIVVEPDNFVDMANSIIKMKKNEELRKVCSENGQVYAKKMYSYKKNYEKYEELIEKLSGRDENVKKNMHVRMESFHQ